MLSVVETFPFEIIVECSRSLSEVEGKMKSPLLTPYSLSLTPYPLLLSTLTETPATPTTR